jgi:uncharacterized protein (DUF3084 family)
MAATNEQCTTLQHAHEAQLDPLRESRDSMRAQIAAYEGQLADVRGERDAARAEAERIRQNLADAREELQQTKARADAFEPGEGSQAKLSTRRGRRE